MDYAQLMREIRRVYDEYLAETTRITKNSKATDGLLGFGHGPDADPCHDRFSERLGQVLADIAERAPSSHDIGEVLRYVYEAPLPYKDNTLVYWMLLAVHALTEELVGLLLPADAAALLILYEEAYPRSTRLPAQKKVAALLKARAGDAAPRRRSFFDKLLGRGRRHGGD